MSKAKISAVAVLLALVQIMAAQPCGPGWTPEFPSCALSGDVYALTTFDDGTGPAWFAAGAIRSAGGRNIDGIVKWDGSQWSRLGAGITYPGGATTPPQGPIRALAVYNDGTGPALYVGGGNFIINGSVSASLAKWDGSSWTMILPSAGASIRALQVYDDGQGPGLFVGGAFTIGALGTNHIACWRGGQFSALGSGMGFGVVQALTVFNDGTGSQLYIGGTFATADAQHILYLARWNGSAYSPVGGGVSGMSSGQPPQVVSMDVSDVGGTPGLFVAGYFTTAGTIPAEKFARWNGTTWTSPPVRAGGSIRVVRAMHDAQGPAVYVGGNFGPGNLNAAGAARWDGQSWTLLGTGLTYNSSIAEAYDFARVSDAHGVGVLVGGHFDHAGGIATSSLARWSGSQWSQIGSGPDASVRAIAQFAGDTYVGGEFNEFANVQGSRGLVRKVGSTWQSVGGGVDGTIYCMVQWDDGTGPALYVGGLFTYAGATPCHNIARWNGSTWSSLNGGIPGSGPGGGSWTGRVNALAVYNDGTAPALYAAGSFESSPEGPELCIGKYDGTDWLPVGGGLHGTNSANALAVYDDGSGPKLWVGTDYNNATVPVSLAAWDGTAWSRPAGTPPFTILSLATYTGAGPAALYFGGLSSFGRIVGSTVQTNLGTPFLIGTAPAVRMLSVADEGSGPKLYAGGRFSSLGSSGPNISRWDGQAWSSLTGTPSDVVYAVAQAAPGKLLVGGDFTSVGFASADRLAAWQGCTCYANCDGSTTGPILNVNDFQCFLNRFAAADPYANCDLSTSAPTLNVNDFQCFLNHFAVGCV